MRTGLIAAGLGLLAAVVVLSGGGRARSATVEHTCSATDRQFINKTELNLTALGIWSEDYRRGEATALEVVREARRAAKRVDVMRPTDPALQTTKPLIAGMLTEYGRGMAAKARQRDAAEHVMRAYGLANFAHEVLADAEVGLRRAGCDVSPLL
jgi:hypothetical protein